MEDYSEYSYNFIQRVLTEVGPRESGSESEEKAAKIIQSELNIYCDNVDYEPFLVHPKAFLGWTSFSIYIYSISFILLTLPYFFPTLYLISPIIATSLNIFLFLTLIFEFVLYKEFIDPLYPKKQSQNVIGKIYPKNYNKDSDKNLGKIDKILIFSGHHDSAYEFNLIKWGKGKLMLPLTILGLIPLFMILINGIWTLIYSMIFQTYRPNVNINLLFSVPFWPFLLVFHFFLDKRAVPGAMDNLSAVSIVLAIAKYLHENKDSEFYPKNSLIYFVSFGSEEAALRGSKRFVRDHINQIKNATLINFESIAKIDLIKVIKKEQTAKLSLELCNEIMEISNNLNIKCKIGTLFFGTGGTDAASFANSGIKATTIIAQPIGPVYYYHTRWDTIDVIQKETLSKVLSLSLNYIKHFDKK
ncbi:MAG: M28 family metallopeptidase [Candidatus Helarchaeota archaeon]